jgi:ABC-type nitrate/sulfonate/bicarbonate transport system permease component
MNRLRALVVKLLAQTWGVLAVLALWQIWVVSAHRNPIVMVSPAAVALDILHNPAVYAGPTLFTLTFAVAGLAAGMALGLLLACLAWSSRTLSGIVGPIGLLISSTPVVCLIPLLARIFGYNARTEFVTVAIMTFFPSFVFAATGLRTLPSMSAALFDGLAASRPTRLLLLALPAAMPTMAIALRVGTAAAVLVTMVAEYLMQTGGLGNMFALTSQAFQTERAWGASLIAMALSVALYSASAAVESHVRNRYR